MPSSADRLTGGETTLLPDESASDQVGAGAVAAAAATHGYTVAFAVSAALCGLGAVLTILIAAVETAAGAARRCRQRAQRHAVWRG